jgi:hypothetical protein
MTPRDAFLDELRTRTQHHLSLLTEESAAILGRFISLPELGSSIYYRLVDAFRMDGAQEIAATLVDLFSGALDHGTVMVNDREYRGLRLVLTEFGAELPDGPRASLQELVTTLARSDRK